MNGFVVQVEHISVEFETLGEAIPQATKKAALFKGINHALPQVFTRLITQPEMIYEQRK